MVLCSPITLDEKIMNLKFTNFIQDHTDLGLLKISTTLNSWLILSAVRSILLQSLLIFSCLFSQISVNIISHANAGWFHGRACSCANHHTISLETNKQSNSQAALQRRVVLNSRQQNRNCTSGKLMIAFKNIKKKSKLCQLPAYLYISRHI